MEIIQENSSFRRIELKIGAKGLGFFSDGNSCCLSKVPKKIGSFSLASGLVSESFL
jgi:hypothetical protein